MYMNGSGTDRISGLLTSRIVELFTTVVCFLLGESPASDLYMPTFRNALSVPSSKAGVK